MVVNKVDVICEHKSDGSVIPLRFQIVDEDGVYQRFTVKGYKLMKKSWCFQYSRWAIYSKRYGRVRVPDRGAWRKERCAAILLRESG